MQRELLITNDGSHTVAIPELGVTYRSKHGAVQESAHVFIEAGLLKLLDEITHQPIEIFELGFGTGLNALLTLRTAQKLQRKIRYICVEPYPLDRNMVGGINYEDLLKVPMVAPAFSGLHEAAWEIDVEINPYFVLHKKQSAFEDFNDDIKVHLVYYDAFGPLTQPQLWTIDSFKKVYTIMKPGGILTTYCSKSEVRRNMVSAGFQVTKLQGPRGKREMVRARRVI
jgi:tRNA U34 5-methylaminomethyl-2-thiouridine-forming methyltransferase MnmC